MLGKLLNFTRRTKSKYVDDIAVDDFTRVLDQVFEDKGNAGEHLEELAKMVTSGIGVGFSRTYADEDGNIQTEAVPYRGVLAEPDAGPPPPGLIDKLRKE